MNIVILNGNPDSTNATFDRYLDRYRIKLHNAGHYVRHFLIREMRISDSGIGGNENWNRGFPPQDDFRYISNTLHETDLIVFASPLERGFVSIMTERIQDRLAAYELPAIGFILQKEPGTCGNDLIRIGQVIEKIASKLRTFPGFFITLDTDLNEAVTKTWQSMELHDQIEHERIHNL